jgi:dipeptidyl aminopeptidase/acylaminoacyl peptidase
MKIRSRAALAIALGAVLAGCGGEEREQPARQQSAQAPRLPTTQSDRIVFSADGDILAINPDGSGRVRLTSTDDEIESNPAWSPDGRRVAFIRGDGSVYVMNADGSAIRRVTEPRAGVEAPGWSPDERRLSSPTNSPIEFRQHCSRRPAAGPIDS